MKQRYIDYTNYNIWANNRLILDLSLVNKSLFTQELIGSFPTIKATLLHLWFAEMGWLCRLEGKPWNTSMVNDFKGSREDLFKAWQETSKHFRDYVLEADLEKEVIFDQKGQTFSIPSREIVQTVCNHGSYHRGQVVMMMRQLGVSEVSQTDYIEWVREKARGNIS